MSKKISFLFLLFTFSFLLFPCGAEELALPRMIVLGEDLSRVAIGPEGKFLADLPTRLKSSFLKGETLIPKFNIGLEILEGRRGSCQFSGQYGLKDNFAFDFTQGRQFASRYYYLLNGNIQQENDEFPDRRKLRGKGNLETGVNIGENSFVKLMLGYRGRDNQVPLIPKVREKKNEADLRLIFRQLLPEQRFLNLEIYESYSWLDFPPQELENNLFGFKGDLRFSPLPQNNLQVNLDIFQDKVCAPYEQMAFVIQGFNYYQVLPYLTLGGGLYTARSTLGRSWQLSPLAECFWHPVPALDFWVKFRPQMLMPRFNQLYGLNDYVRTNFKLRPERRYIVLEEGGKYQAKDFLTVQINLSQQWIKDFIIWSDTTNNLAMPFNLEKEVNDISARVSIKYNYQGKFIQELNYTYEKTSQRIPYLPEHRAGFVTRLKLPGPKSASGLELSLEGQLWSKQYHRKDDWGKILPEAKVVNFYVSREISQHFLVFLKWNNLFQQKYYTRYIYPRQASILLLGVKGKF